METVSSITSKLKIGIVGPKGAGKTMFVRKIIGNLSGLPQGQTIGIDHHVIELEHTKLGHIPILLWDCSSSDTYKSLIADVYAPHFDALVYLYDCSKRANFLSHAHDTITRINSKMKEGIVAVFANNACGNSQSPKTGEDYANKNQFLFGCFCVEKDSRKSLENVLFLVIEKILTKDKQRYVGLCKNSMQTSKYLEWLGPRIGK